MSMRTAGLGRASKGKSRGRWTAILGIIVFAALAGFWIASQRWDRVERVGPIFPGIAAGIEGSPVDKGAYIYRAAGCAACHTAKGGEELAGGHAFATPFGTFYSSNITPDPATGIGGWSDEDLIRAMRKGIGPDGSHYFPAFPYTSYTLMADDDIRALKAYLDTVPPVSSAVADHEMAFPLNLLPIGLVRFGMTGWKWLYFDEGPYRSEAGPAEVVLARGEYLVRGLSHCGACHTPRNFLGATKTDNHLEGAKKGPDGKSVPAIHYHEQKGIGAWQKEDITFALETGMKPDGDVMGGAMAKVVEDGTSHLALDDLNAIAAYLMTLTPEESK
ncbi:MAG: cytochrome c [Alphaproteobacteria bacterium]|nr:cytochrome c [Alphaproteobacteria bacterium]